MDRAHNVKALEARVRQLRGEIFSLRHQHDVLLDYVQTRVSELEALGAEIDIGISHTIDIENIVATGRR